MAFFDSCDRPGVADYFDVVGSISFSERPKRLRVPVRLLPLELLELPSFCCDLAFWRNPSMLLSAPSASVGMPISSTASDTPSRTADLTPLRIHSKKLKLLISVPLFKPPKTWIGVGRYQVTDSRSRAILRRRTRYDSVNPAYRTNC